MTANRASHFALLARYNEWMNASVYAAAATLDAAALEQDRGAFFGSIAATLRHILWADVTWTGRLAQVPEIAAAQGPWTPPLRDDKGQHVFADFAAQWAHRRELDALLVRWMDATVDAALDTPVTYANTKGVIATRALDGLLLHLFNHQTHHRGQVTTLLTQAGIDVGSTDLVGLVPTLEVGDT